MKKIFMLLSVFLFLMPNPAFADSCRSLVITGHPTYRPIAWEAKGKIVGAAPELVTAIAKELGVKTVISKSFGTWAKAQEAAGKGEADIIFGIYKNDERMGYLNYMETPFMRDPVVIAVRKGEAFPFEKWDDLKGKKGVTNEGESYGNEFDDFMNKNLVVERVRGIDRAFQELMDKKADYMIVGKYPGYNELKKLRASSKVEFLQQELSSFDMYIAFAKKSKCYDALKEGFSLKLKEYKEQGKVRQLLEKAAKKK